MGTSKKTLRNVILFSLVAISCGWIGVGVNQLLGEPSNLESLGSGIFYCFSYCVYDFAPPFWVAMVGKISL